MKKLPAKIVATVLLLLPAIAQADDAIKEEAPQEVKVRPTLALGGVYHRVLKLDTYGGEANAGITLDWKSAAGTFDLSYAYANTPNAVAFHMMHARLTVFATADRLRIGIGLFGGLDALERATKGTLVTSVVGGAHIATQIDLVRSESSTIFLGLRGDLDWYK